MAVYTEHFNNFLFCQLKLRLDPKDSIQTVFVVGGEGRLQGALGSLFGDRCERDWYRVARLRKQKRQPLSQGLSSSLPCSRSKEGRKRHPGNEVAEETPYLFPPVHFPFWPNQFAQDCSTIPEPQQAKKKTEQRHKGGRHCSKNSLSHITSPPIPKTNNTHNFKKLLVIFRGPLTGKKRQPTDTHSSSKSLKHTLLM